MADITLPGSLLAGPLGWIYKKLKSFGRLLWDRHKTKRAEGTHFTILIASLHRDEDGSQKAHILHSLESQFGCVGDGASIRVLPYPDALTLGAGDRNAAIIAADTKGHKWLKKKNADILIWGEAAASNKTLRLRFTRPETATGAATSYTLTDEFELPANFGEDFGAVLAMLAVTGVQPINDKAGHALAEILEPITGKLRPLAENPPATFSDDDKARLWHAYAAGEQRLGEEKGDSSKVTIAITYYQRVLDIWPRERVPLQWAMTQTNLGNALLRLGEREIGPARLEEAVAAFREGLKELTRERVPLQWAGTQTNLGAALARLGERESGTARLEEAVAAFREGLKERTRERVPLDWATTQNNLGTALSNLGARESGPARLEEAVTAYREGLKERTRERVPLDWAATQNNLGTALRVLAERQAESDPALARRTLEEARKAMTGALEVQRNSKADHYIAQSEHNLALIDKAIARLVTEATEPTA